jgi:hypothetical protein
MKNLFALLAMAGFVSVAAAQTAAARAPLAPAANAASPADNTSFCYYEGKPYSKGAILNGMQCSAEVSASVFAGDERRLVWQEVKR